MKLRVRNNSIRLRLTQPEVARFDETGGVEEFVEFGLTPDERLVYTIEKADVATTQADFQSGKIRVLIPLREADEWTKTNRVGIETMQEIGDGKFLKILIEKDFACTTRRDGEDDRDAFPHPEKIC